MNMAYSCKHCGKEFEKKQKLGGHSRTCQLNPRYQENLQQLAVARSQISFKDREKVQCDFCDKSYTSSAMNLHVWQYHGEGIEKHDPAIGYKNGTRQGWNKGLTKETDERIAKIAATCSLRTKGKPRPERRKNLNLEEIIKLTNLADNYNASELVDHSLAKNTRKTVTILNENNYSDEDNIIIIRTLLAKLKRLVKIHELVDEKNNIEQAISACKPPIFWKDKPLITQQIKSWEKNHLKNLIYKTNEIELLVKKNSVLAKNILADFIINNSKKTNN